MDDIKSDTLYNSIRNSDKLILNPSDDKYSVICCCISKKWCFDHIGIAGINEYDKNMNNFCICLDCCVWCFEFYKKKYAICKNQTNFYLCCCGIYFI